MGKDLGSRLLGVLFALGMRLGRSSGVRSFTKTSYVRGGDSHVDDIRRAKNPVTTGNKHLCAGREMGEGESERHMSPVWHVTNVSRLARDTSQVSQVLHDGYVQFRHQPHTLQHFSHSIQSVASLTFLPRQYQFSGRIKKERVRTRPCYTCNSGGCRMPSQRIVRRAVQTTDAQHKKTLLQTHTHTHTHTHSSPSLIAHRASLVGLAGRIRAKQTRWECVE